MTRYIASIFFALGFVGTASAQGPQDAVTALNNVDDGVTNLVGNVQGTTVSLLSGDATATAGGLNDSLTGLAVDLSAGTPAEPLGDIAVQIGDQLLSASEPLTSALDGPASQLAGLGAPLTDPLKTVVGESEFELTLDFVAPDLPGGGGLPLPGLGDGGLPLPGLGGGGLPLPGLDGLPLPGLGGGGLPLPLPGLPS